MIRFEVHVRGQRSRLERWFEYWFGEEDPRVSGFAVFVDELGGVRLRGCKIIGNQDMLPPEIAADLMKGLVGQDPPDHSLAQYMAVLGQVRERNPLLAVLEQIPIEELDGAVVTLDKPDTTTVLVTKEGQPERQVLVP